MNTTTQNPHDKFDITMSDDVYSSAYDKNVKTFPDPKTFRTGTIPPDCPLIDNKKHENNKENNS